MTADPSKYSEHLAFFTRSTSSLAMRFLGMTLITVLAVSTTSAQSGDLRARVVHNHIQYLPAGDGPFSTLIAIPGCSGIALTDPAAEAAHPELREDDRLFRAHYPLAAERLRDAGYAVLLVNIQAAEELVTACSGQIPASRMAEYIDEAIGWASTLDFVDPARLQLIGWSMGGGGILAWLEKRRAGSDAIKSATVVYPGCRNIEPLTVNVPLLMLLGEADDIAPPELCEQLATRSANREAVRVHSYPGARHGYDVEDAPARLDIGNGMTVGYQREAAEDTWRVMFSFLSESGK